MNLYQIVKTAMPGTLVANPELGIKPFVLSTEHLKHFGVNDYLGITGRQPTHIKFSSFSKQGWVVADEYPQRTFSESTRRKLAPVAETAAA